MSQLLLCDKLPQILVGSYSHHSLSLDWAILLIWAIFDWACLCV